MQAAIRKHGKPDIINSDQGSQYTSAHQVTFLNKEGIRISMDGKGRATDNAHIERFFGTIKRKQIRLNPPSNGLELFEGLQAKASGNWKSQTRGTL